MPYGLSRYGAIWLCMCFAFYSFSSVKAADWPTWGYDPQRSGWAREERDLSPENVANLELKWKTRVKNEPKALAALTAPLVAADVTTPQGIKTLVYVAGASNNLHAIDAATGAIIWSREFDPTMTPVRKESWLCPNNLNATPVIDRRTNTIYVLKLDGRLEGIDLGTGKTKFAPVQFVPPFAKDYSLNLVDGVIYTTIAQGCGGAASGIYVMDIREPFRTRTYNLFVSSRGGNGIWGRGGASIGDNGMVFALTGDGPWDPPNGWFGSSMIGAKLANNDFKVVDYYTPHNWRQINLYDWDMGCTPVWFTHQGHRLLAGGGKEGVCYLVDADDMGSRDHHTPLYVTPRLSNDEDTFEGAGIWGALAAWQDTDGESWVYVPIYGKVSVKAPKFPVTNGDNPNGCLMAFNVKTNPETKKPMLAPAWMSGNLAVPDPPVIANGVVFVLSTGENVQQTVQGGIIFKNKLQLLTAADRAGKTQSAELLALDAKTGKTLYRSGKAMEKWTHFSGLAVANGQVYTVDHSSQVYAFGLKKKAGEGE